MLIGIDPDIQKSGVAEYDQHTGYFNVSAMKFFDLYEFLKANKERIELVRIEGGWLNKKSNFHGIYGQSKAAGERIAMNVGSNHEVGRKIAEMCEFLNLEYDIVRPLGTKSIDHLMFCRITGFKGRTSQDTRDAGILVFGYKINKKSITI